LYLAQSILNRLQILQKSFVILFHVSEFAFVITAFSKNIKLLNLGDKRSIKNCNLYERLLNPKVK